VERHLNGEVEVMKSVSAKKIIVLILAFVLMSVLFVGCGGNNGSSAQKPKTSNITVIVKDDTDSMLPEVLVTLGGMSGKTDSSGKYVFSGVEAGDYTIKAEKNGYESAEQQITVSAGKDQTINLTLKKKETETELIPVKDVSNVKSFRSTFEVTNKKDPANNSKGLIEQDNYGKDEHIVVYGADGKKSLEAVVVGDKAKVLQGGSGQWMEVPAAMFKQLTQGYLESFMTFENTAVSSYNEWIKAPGGDYSYKVKASGHEVVNGYSTTKYVISGKEKTTEGIVNGTITMWIINKGPYKGYITRLIMDGKYPNGDESTVRIDTKDFGKDMGIKLP
jgi:hypothetical protein